MTQVLCSTLRLLAAVSLLFACGDGETERKDGSVDADSGAESCEAGTACGDVYSCPRVNTASWSLVLALERVCDGIADCHGAEDERDCAQRENMFCARDDEGGSKVYRPEEACDGRAHCFFAEDERDCPDSFLCPIHQVGGGWSAIPKSKVCDGVWDCPTDEFDCPGLTDPFVCPNGKTIDRKFVCDQGADCSQFGFGGKSGSADEIEPSCHQYACSLAWASDTPPRTACPTCKQLFIHESKVCDGVLDCEEGDDERACPEPFACAGGLFVRSRARCDGKPDCPQGDDENSCP